MSSIRLHHEKGLNPKLTCCRNCRKDVGIALPGADDGVYQCLSSSCGIRSIGRPRDNSCPKCRNSIRLERRLDEFEKLYIELCPDCEAKEDACAAEVKKGGVFWKCKDCGSAGALKAEVPLAKAVRKQSGIATPNPIGIEFSKEEMCPVCSEHKVAEQPAAG